jgi:hypothetical protein
MKVKLLKKFKKQIPVYHSKERKVNSTRTGEEIFGRFLLSHPLKKINYYCDTKKDAIERRRSIILDLLEDYRITNFWTKKRITL